MSASSGEASNSLTSTASSTEQHAHSQTTTKIEVKNKPIGLDELSVSLLADCVHDSRIIFRGYICRRERVAVTTGSDPGGSGGCFSAAEADDMFVLYWAVLRAKHLFLFYNEDSTQCKEAIDLSKFSYQPDIRCGPPDWPKGFKVATLRSASIAAAQESSNGSNNSSGVSDDTQHHLGWWSGHYNWQSHIRDQVAKAHSDPISVQMEHRKLLIAAKELQTQRSAATSAALAAAAEGFEPPQLPIKKEKSKTPISKLITRLRSHTASKAEQSGFSEVEAGRQRSNSSSSGGGVGGGGPQPPSSHGENEYDVYKTIDPAPEPDDDEETYVQPGDPAPSPPGPAVPLKPPKPQKPATVTQEMLSSHSRQLRPIPTPMPRSRSDDGDVREHRQGASAAAGGEKSILLEQLVSGEAIDAAVNYFYWAFVCKPLLPEAICELEASPVGSFVVHGGSSNRGGGGSGGVGSRSLRLLTLLVRSSDPEHPVCRYTIREASHGAEIVGTVSSASHASVNQLLYHHHIHDLPFCSGQSERPVRLARPLHLTRRTSFLSASVWCLGDKPQCFNLLKGAQEGTFALLVDSHTNQLSLYAIAEGGQSVKMRINSDGQKSQQQQQRFWVSESEKFESLENFLLHYHRHSLWVIVADSGGKQVPLRLTTPCQLSKKFQANLQQYLSDHVTEEYTDMTENGRGEQVVSSRRLGGACVHTVTSVDGDEGPPELIAAGLTLPAAVLVEKAQVHGYQWIYRMKDRVEVEFDSIDKLLMYASVHPHKLA